MKKSLIYSFLAFLVCSVGVSLGTHTYAVDFSWLFVCNSSNYPCSQWMGYDNASNSLTPCDPSTSFCNARITYSDIKYIWIDNNSKFYQTLWITNWIWNSWGSPLTVWVWYSNAWANNNDYAVKVFNGSSSSSNSRFPWISYKANWEWIDFSFIRGSEWKIVYSVPSNTAFILNYQWVDYTINKVFFYPNRFIFANSDLSFMFEVGAGWYVGDGFFVVNPSYSKDNLYFVQPSVLKAWSTTISTTDAWDLLLWNEAYSSKTNYNWTSSYTLTIVAGWSIFPSGFANARQDWNMGFSYTLDLQYESPNWGNSWWSNNWWNNSWSNNIIQEEYLSCVWKYWYVSQLSLALQNLKNWIGVDYDYTWYLYQYEWAASFDWSYTWLDVQINNIVLDKTFVSSVNHVWEISQASPHTYVYYFNQAVSNITNPSNIISIYCWENPLPNQFDMLRYDDPFWNNELNLDYTWNIDDCAWYDILCNMEIWKNKNSLLESTLWEIWWYINILFSKIASPVIDSFNEWSNSTIWNRLQCWNYTTIPIIDYIQYLLLFFIFIFFIKLL